MSALHNLSELDQVRLAYSLAAKHRNQLEAKVERLEREKQQAVEALREIAKAEFMGLGNVVIAQEALAALDADMGASSEPGKQAEEKVGAAPSEHNAAPGSEGCAKHGRQDCDDCFLEACCS